MATKFTKEYDQLRMNGYSHEEAISLVEQEVFEMLEDDIDEDELHVLEEVSLADGGEVLSENQEDFDTQDTTSAEEQDDDDTLHELEFDDENFLDFDDQFIDNDFDY